MKRARRKTDDTGAELIELAIVLPILLLVVAGIMDFGFLFQRYEVVTNAAREGARLAVLPGYGPGDVRSRVQSYLTGSGLTGSATIPDPVFNTVALPSGLSVTTVRVNVDYPTASMFLGPIAAMIGGTSWGTITLKANSVLRVEGGS